MKLQLLLFAVLIGVKSLAQVNGFNSDAFGFELTNVSWTSAGTHNGAISPGNIVDAWTQDDGFEQSSEQKNSGTYSMLADFSSTIPATSPKLQTWRSNTGGEGKYEFATVDNYTLSAYVYVDAALTDGAMRIAIQQNGGQYNSLAIDLSSITPNTWTQFSVAFDQNDPKSGYWSDANFTTLPTSNAKIYIDDISVMLTSVLSTKNTSLNNVKVFQNKAAQVLEVTGLKNGDVTIYNCIGEIVKASNSKSDASQIDISDMPTGVYFVRISLGGKTKTEKIIIQ